MVEDPAEVLERMRPHLQWNVGADLLFKELQHCLTAEIQKKVKEQIKHEGNQVAVETILNELLSEDDWPSQLYRALLSPSINRPKLAKKLKSSNMEGDQDKELDQGWASMGAGDQAHITKTKKSNVKYTGNTKVKNLPTKFMDVLKQNLDIEEGWKLLAVQLGYSPEDVAYIDVKTGSPTENLILQWIHEHPDANLEAIFTSLLKMECKSLSKELREICEPRSLDYFDEAAGAAPQDLLGAEPSFSIPDFNPVMDFLPTIDESLKKGEHESPTISPIMPHKAVINQMDVPDYSSGSGDQDGDTSVRVKSKLASETLDPFDFNTEKVPLTESPGSSLPVSTLESENNSLTSKIGYSSPAANNPSHYPEIIPTKAPKTVMADSGFVESVDVRNQDLAEDGNSFASLDKNFSSVSKANTENTLAENTSEASDIVTGLPVKDTDNSESSFKHFQASNVTAAVPMKNYDRGDSNDGTQIPSGISDTRIKSFESGDFLDNPMLIETDKNSSSFKIPTKTDDHSVQQFEVSSKAVKISSVSFESSNPSEDQILVSSQTTDVPTECDDPVTDPLHMSGFKPYGLFHSEETDQLNDPIFETESKDIEIVPRLETQSKEIKIDPIFETESKDIEIDPRLETQSKEIKIDPIFETESKDIEIDPRLETQSKEIKIDPIFEAESKDIEIDPRLETQSKEIKIDPRLEAVSEDIEAAPELKTAKIFVDNLLESALMEHLASENPSSASEQQQLFSPLNETEDVKESDSDYFAPDQDSMLSDKISTLSNLEELQNYFETKPQETESLLAAAITRLENDATITRREELDGMTEEKGAAAVETLEMTEGNIAPPEIEARETESITNVAPEDSNPSRPENKVMLQDIKEISRKTTESPNTTSDTNSVSISNASTVDIISFSESDPQSDTKNTDILVAQDEPINNVPSSSESKNLTSVPEPLIPDVPVSDPNKQNEALHSDMSDIVPYPIVPYPIPETEISKTDLTSIQDSSIEFLSEVPSETDILDVPEFYNSTPKTFPVSAEPLVESENSIATVETETSDVAITNTEPDLTSLITFSELKESQTEAMPDVDSSTIQMKTFLADSLDTVEIPDLTTEAEVVQADDNTLLQKRESSIELSVKAEELSLVNIDSEILPIDNASLRQYLANLDQTPCVEQTENHPINRKFEYHHFGYLALGVAMVGSGMLILRKYWK